MAQGFSGNVATLGAAVQTARGTAATTPTIKTKFTGGNVSPNSVVNRLSETAATRDQGAAYKSAESVSGTPQIYLRPDDAHDWFYYALGVNGDTGSGPFVHTATPSSSDLPYLTIFKMLAASSGAGAILEKHVDCKVNSLKISAQNGQPATLDVDLMGLSPTRPATNDVVTATTTSPFTFDQLTITKGGVAIATCQSFDITIANNLQLMQGNGSITPFDIFPGELQISGTATLLYTDAGNYGAVSTTSTGSQAISASTLNIGSNAGLAAAGSVIILGQLITYTSTTSTTLVGCTGGVGGAGTLPASSIVLQPGSAASRVLYQEPLTFTLTSGTSSVAITCTKATYTDVPVDPDPSGAPLQSALAFSVEPGSPTISVVTTNSVTTVG